MLYPYGMGIPSSNERGYRSKYASGIVNFASRKIPIGPEARRILRYFIGSSRLSVSDISRKMKPTGYWSAYKNIHKKVQRLLLLNLITQDKGYESKRGEIMYRLTSEGVFYLLMNSIFLFREDLKGLVKYYGGDDFFYEFVYPYLSKESILKIIDEVFFIDLSQHMRDICYKLNAMADYEEESCKLETNPKNQIAVEPPLKQVLLMPLRMSLMNSCEYLDKKDLTVLSYDVRFMKEYNKRTNQYESMRKKLLALRQNV